MNTPTIETERLVLRKFDKQDVPALFSIYSDKDVNIFLPWFPLISLEEAYLFFEKQYHNIYKEPMGFRYAICLKTNNIPIGYVHVNTNDSYDFGYGLQKDYWHQGIVSEACQAIIALLKTTNIPYITATHDVNNPRSGEVMKRLGMTYCYSYEEQWMPKDTLVTFRMYQLHLDGEKAHVYKKYWDTSVVHYIEMIE